MDSYSFGSGVLITAFAIAVLGFVGYVAYTGGKANMHRDIKDYGCEKTLEIYEKEQRPR